MTDVDTTTIDRSSAAAAAPASPAVAAARMASRTRRRGGIVGHFSHTHILLTALAGVIIFGRFVSPNFFTLGNLRNILLNVSILGMLALGMTLVMLLREIDLSVGSLMAFAPIAAVKLTDLVHSADTTIIMGGNIVVGGTVWIIVFTLLVSAVIGLVNGLITVKGPVPSVIVTLGALFALRGASYVVSDGNQYYLTELPNFMWLGSETVFEYVPVSFVLFFVLGVLGVIGLRFTKIGRRIYAVGGNEKAALYSGINAARWKVIALTVCGLCAGIAALIFSSRLGSAESAQAEGFELSAIAIAVIGGVTLEGGRGTLFNAMLSSVLLAIIMNIIALRGIVSWYQTVIEGAIIIAAGFAYTARGRSANAP